MRVVIAHLELAAVLAVFTVAVYLLVTMRKILWVLNGGCQ
jgi:hypothetical protein